MTIHGGLMEAYIGHYEEEWEYTADYEAYVMQETKKGHVAVESYQGWLYTQMVKKIRSDTPKERLTRYLEWNGILGYTGTIWEISQGGFEV